MNKKTRQTFSFIFLLIMLFNTVAGAEDLSFTSAKTIGQTIENAIPIEFGYIDNTEYYMSRYFASMNGVDDCYIVTSAESTNFNEFGIFHLKTRNDIKTAKKVLRSYLDKRKTEFEGGIVYNADEYPKFQNASVFAVGNYICYTILVPSDVKKASVAVKNMLIK